MLQSPFENAALEISALQIILNRIISLIHPKQNKKAENTFGFLDSIFW